MKHNRNIHKSIYILLSLAGLVILAVIAQNVIIAESASKSLTAEIKKDCFSFTLPDSNIAGGIRLRLKSAIAIDNATKKVLYCYNADKIWPIASISKLLTAMVVLDHYRPDTIIAISKEDSRQSSRSLFRTGEKVKARDLLHAALMQSDNRAARALARSVAGTLDKFVVMMNKKAKDLEMLNTIMYEPTGLDERNSSTAAECAKLVNAAMIQYPEIARITSLRSYTFKPMNRRNSRRLVNTNKLVYSKYRVCVGKTGFINESAYCLTTVLENGSGRKVTVVVLGAPGPQTRFREARRLATFAFSKPG